MPAFWRASDFSGSTYEPRFLSEKIEVFQTAGPAVTSTGSEPQPFSMCPKRFLMALAPVTGSVSKYHAAGP